MKATQLGLLLLFVGIACAESNKTCPSSLFHGESMYPDLDNPVRMYGDSCYKFFIDKKREFHTAQSACELDNGHLAVVKDAETMLFIAYSLKEVVEIDPFWIGLSDELNEKQFVWQNGELLKKGDFAFFGKGQGPDHKVLGSLENCVAINQMDGFRWHDYQCGNMIQTSKKHFICQYPAVSVEPSSS